MDDEKQTTGEKETIAGDSLTPIEEVGDRGVSCKRQCTVGKVRQSSDISPTNCYSSTIPNTVNQTS